MHEPRAMSARHKARRRASSTVHALPSSPSGASQAAPASQTAAKTVLVTAIAESVATLGNAIVDGLSSDASTGPASKPDVR